jgi:hypothetical protein
MIRQLVIEINLEIEKVDESLSCEDFAKAIAIILKDNFGQHNYNKFLKTLNNKINATK